MAMKEVSDRELKTVIADFLDMGHVENIVAMFRRDSGYYAWTGELLHDSRLQVRLGVSVLFEELRLVDPGGIERAIPSLRTLLRQSPPAPAYVRGDAIGVLGIIGGETALAEVREVMADPDPVVAEVARDILGEVE
jgi:HEAT repeat protein